jgi:hypothetical protein
VAPGAAAGGVDRLRDGALDVRVSAGRHEAEPIGAVGRLGVLHGCDLGRRKQTGMLTGIKARAEGKYSHASNADPADTAVEPMATTS